MMMLMMPVICAKRGESKGEPAGPDGGTKGCGLRAVGCGLYKAPWRDAVTMSPDRKQA